MLGRLRKLSLWMVASYLLVLAAAPFFHSHGDLRCTAAIASTHDGHAANDHTHDGSSPCSGEPLRSCDDQCAVCHFLAQQTLASCDAPEATAALLEQKIAPWMPATLVRCAVSSWHSRAPPALG